MNWKEQEKQLRDAKFSDEEIYGEYQRQRATLEASGQFSAEEIDSHFGIKTYDTKELQKAYEGAIQQHFSDETKTKMKSATGVIEVPGGAKVAENFWEAVKAGFQLSNTGLIYEGKSPDTVVPDDAPIHHRVASMAATVIGDIPTSLVGGYVGTVGGAALGTLGGPSAEVTIPAGAAVGGGFGSMAAPAFVRTYLMDAYEKGEVTSFKEFWDRSSLAFMEAFKQGIVGAATAGVGKGLGVKLPEGMNPLAKATTIGAAELGVMTTLGAAMEGQMPKPKDFVDGAIILAGFNTVGAASNISTRKMATKLRAMYAESGIKPADIVLEAQKNPVLREQIFSDAETIELNGQKVKSSLKPRETPKMPEAEKLAELETKVETNISDAKAAELKAAQAKIDERIVYSGEKGAPKQFSATEWYTDWVAADYPIKKFVELGKVDYNLIPADQNPHILFRMKNGYKSYMTHFIDFGPMDFNTREAIPGMKGLKEILAPINEAKLGKEFIQFAVSERADELRVRGIDKKIDPEAAKIIKKEYGSTMRPVLDELVGFENSVLKYAKDAGLLNEQSYKSMEKAGKSYVPLHTVVDDAFSDAARSKPSSLKRIKGSENKIVNPITSVLENTESLLRASEVNRARKSVIEYAEANDLIGEEGIIRKVPDVVQKTTVSEKEMKAYFKERGIEATPEAMDVYRHFPKFGLKENQFEVWRDGKRQVYETEPLIAKVLQGLDGEAGSSNLALKLMSGITSVKKFGITATPEFVAKNAFRDKIFSAISTKGGIGFKEITEAVGHIWKQDETFQRFLRSGSNAIYTEFGENYAKNNLLKLYEDAGAMSRVRNQVKTAADRIAFAARLVELAPRVAEMKAKSKGATGGADLVAGGFAANEVTLDFSRRGAKMSAFNAITAFANVQIQGVDRIARLAKDNPKELGMKGIAYITAPSVTLWAINHDEPWYKQIPQWEKDTFWHIKVGENIYRFPKPQELGLIFGSIPERMLEAFVAQNPTAGKNLASTILGAFTPNAIPDAVQPLLEQFFNYKTFTETPIVPASMEGMLPHEQYTNYTSESAKLLGNLIGYVDEQTLDKLLGKNTRVFSKFGGKDAGLGSPLVLENYIKQWGGQWGNYGLQFADMLLQETGVVEDNEPKANIADYPVVKAFISRYPRADAKPITDFWDNYKRHMPVVKSFQKRVDSGDVEGAKEYQAKYPESFALKGVLENTAAALTKQTRLIQKIQSSKIAGKSAEEIDKARVNKSQLIENTYLRMLEITTRVNEEIYKIEKKSK